MANTLPHSKPIILKWVRTLLDNSANNSCTQKRNLKSNSTVRTSSKQRRGDPILNAENEFNGFSKKGITFLRQLKKNNDRDWFQTHKPLYDKELITPSKLFLASAAGPLKKIVPSLQITPRSMGRIYRDMRFSDDKTPYHTHLSFLFKDSRSRTELAPRLYFGFDPTGLAFGAGIFQFQTSERERFRMMITEGNTAKAFTKIMKDLRKKTKFEPRGKALKKLPLGFDAKHPNSEFYFYNGLYVVHEEDFPKAFFKKDFIAYLTKTYQPLVPFMNWMSEFSRSIPNTFDHKRFTE